MGRSVLWRTLGDFWRLVVVSAGRGARRPGVETRNATQPLRCTGHPVIQLMCPWCQGLGALLWAWSPAEEASWVP